MSTASPAPIRTPDQRLRVFVSSTLAELADERAAVARAVTALGLTPVMFELGARPHPPRDLYRAYLEQSDIFVGLYWQRYGWVAPDMDISGLEDEFRLSTETAMPRLLYVKDPAPEREPGLTAMIEALQNDATESYRRFGSTRELGRLVRDDLALLLSERFQAQAQAQAQVAQAETQAPTQPERPQPQSPPTAGLPVVTTSLVGREDDIDRVVDLLHTARLVTLTGPGGIGKTRLATAVADRAGAAVDSVFFVPLASISETDLVLPRIVAALGIAADAARAPLDAIAEHLGDTPTLLVLDNLEQVVGVAPQLDELLARAPGLRVLATSRTVLRLRVEREYPVEPLAVPAVGGRRPSVDEVAALPAVQLFVDRAQAVRPSFTLTEANALEVAEVCRRLDGLPLAIELAAARSRLLDPHALLERLGRSLDALGTGPVDLPERQRTLRATVEWSVGLLETDERDLVAALAVFEDGWPIDAVAEVAGIDEDRSLDLLDALAGHSLVQVAAGPDAGPRFRMLEAVREYAAELLAARPDRTDIEARHAHYFRAMVDASDWARPGFDMGAWQVRMEGEEGNLRVAIRWFLAHDVAPLPHLFRILWPFWQAGDHFPEASRAWIDELRPRLGDFDHTGQIELLVTHEVVAIELGDDEAAVEVAAQIQRLMPHIDDDFLHHLAELVLSWALPIEDDLDNAIQAATQALEGFQGQDMTFMIGSALMTVGTLALIAGRYDVARDRLQEARALGRRSGDDWFVSGSQAQLVMLELDDGHVDEARHLLDNVLDDPRASGIGIHSVAFCLVAYARLALIDDDPVQAAMAMGAADGLRRRAGLRLWPAARRGEAEVLAQAEAALDPHDFDKAFIAGAQLNRWEAINLVRRRR